MKIFKASLRVWVAISSIFGFVVGWSLLAHSPAPAKASQPAPQVDLGPIPTLAPLTSLNSSTQSQSGFQVQQFNTIPNTRSGFRLRTGAS
jgi:hypothetical protein